jgi:hypothetical protein
MGNSTDAFIVKCAGGFLAVTRNKWNGGAVFEQVEYGSDAAEWE